MQLRTLLLHCASQMRGVPHGAAQVREVVQEAGLKPFPDPFIEGFKYDEEGRIVYPGMQVQVRPFSIFNYIEWRVFIANALAVGG